MPTWPRKVRNFSRCRSNSNSACRLCRSPTHRHRSSCPCSDKLSNENQTKGGDHLAALFLLAEQNFPTNPAKISAPRQNLPGRYFGGRESLNNDFHLLAQQRKLAKPYRTPARRLP